MLRFFAKHHTIISKRIDRRPIPDKTNEKQGRFRKGRSENPFGRPRGIRNKAAFQKYTRYGMSLLKDLIWYFQEAGLEAKRKLLASIFPAKLTFQDGKYRTDGLNPALVIILQKANHLESKKCGDTLISENVSGDVLGAGAFSNQFLEGMKQLYELEPFIKVKPYLTNQWEKSGRVSKNAS